MVLAHIFLPVAYALYLLQVVLSNSRILSDARWSENKGHFLYFFKYFVGITIFGGGWKGKEKDLVGLVIRPKIFVFSGPINQIIEPTFHVGGLDRSTCPFSHWCWRVPNPLSISSTAVSIVLWHSTWFIF